MAYAQRQAQAKGPEYTAVITVTEKSQPKTNFLVKTADGQEFWAKPEVAAFIHVGGQYEVKYTSSVFNNKQYDTIFFAKQLTAPSASPALQATVPPSSPQGSPAERRGETRHKDEQIATLALMKSIALSENANFRTIANQLKQCALAWREFKQWQQTNNIETSPKAQAAEPEFDDEIPFS